MLLFSTSYDFSHAAKPRARAKVPDLKILSVEALPLPFIPMQSNLTLTIRVELPKNVPGEALLDVTTLITSTSKFSIRLLNTRQTVNGDPDTPAVSETDPPPRLVEVVQVWDGTDQTKHMVSDGRYDFQVQAKLMVVGKSGPLTRATAWKKRGNFEVRTE